MDGAPEKEEFKMSELLSSEEAALHKALQQAKAQQQSRNLPPGEPPALKFQIAGESPKYSPWPKRKIKRSWIETVKKHQTKRIRITKSVLIDGRPCVKGSIEDLAPIVADDLVAAGCAAQVNVFSRLFARIWFFVDSRTERKRS